MTVPAPATPTTYTSSDHPCFDEAARARTARVHLPVAPRCNVQCNYCNRKFDCVSESRPGVTSVVLGAGRETKESSIDFSAGIMIHKKYGELVKKGEKIATLYTSKQELLAPAAKKYLDAIVIGAEQPAAIPLVFARVEKDRVEKY